MTNRLLKNNVITPTLQFIRLGHKTTAKKYDIQKKLKRRYQAIALSIFVLAWILTALMIVGIYNLFT
jgi:hypothetical protein